MHLYDPFGGLPVIEVFPKLMVSDNAKTFKFAENKLSALFEFQEVQDYFLAKRIQWKYNLEEAPWC